MRKIIQIFPIFPNAGDGRESVIYALCNDGTVWILVYGSDKWERAVSIPQDTEYECFAHIK